MIHEPEFPKGISPKPALGSVVRSVLGTVDRGKLLPHAIYAAIEAAWKTRDMRLSWAIFHVARLSMGGWYHDIRLSDPYTTYSVGGRRPNRPYNLDNFPKLLWDLISAELGGDSFDGLNVVDIGPAEGFFTLKLAQAGSRVAVIHPRHYFMTRLKHILTFYGLKDRVTVITGLYPKVGLREIRRADLIVCLGLIYHLENLVEGLRPMLRSKATLVIESMIYKETFPKNRCGYSEGFDPERHANDQPVCPVWLSEHLRTAGYSVKWLDKWREFSERSGNPRYKTRLDGEFAGLGECITRGALIARYHT